MGGEGKVLVGRRGHQLGELRFSGKGEAYLKKGQPRRGEFCSNKKRKGHAENG